MLKRLMGVCLILVIAAAFGCSAGDPTTQVKSLLGREITAMETLVKQLKEVDSAAKLAKTYREFNDSIEALAPELKKVMEQNAEMIKGQPEAFSNELNRLGELTMDMMNIHVDKIEFYRMDPEVEKEMQRMQNLMNDMSM
jgi:hypothetical protein